MWWVLVVVLIFAILAVIFALQNSVLVTAVFFSWEFEGSLALMLLIALAVGVIIGLLVLLPGIMQRNRNLRTQRKKITGFEKTNTELESQIQQLKKQLEPPVVVPPPTNAAVDIPSQPVIETPSIGEPPDSIVPPANPPFVS